MTRARSVALISVLLPLGAAANVVQSSPDGAIIEHHFEIRAAPDAAWTALVHPERWWPSDHTWSGDAKNLRLDPHAGGCFCETWSDAGAEHGRVVLVEPGKLLRIRGALGPLQEMAVTGVLTVTLVAAQSGGTEATVTYRISGDASHKLDAFAPVVDKVIGLQFGAFASYASRAQLKAGL